jgi:hypothetical protein
MSHFAPIAMRRILTLFLRIAMPVTLAIAPASLAQTTHDDLPPLKATDSAANAHTAGKADGAGKPISVMDFEMLVPPAQLICWSHGAGENPQGSHNNGDGDGARRSSEPGDPHSDPILTTTSATPRNEGSGDEDHDNSDYPPEENRN